MGTIPREFLELMTQPWRAQPDTTLGGWCLTLAEDPRTTSEGALPIAVYLSREVAEHLADLHNRSLAEGGSGGPVVPRQSDDGTAR